MQCADDLALAQRAAVRDLDAWADWSRLDPRDRDVILNEAKLIPGVPPPTDTDATLLDALDQTPLTAWRDRISLVLHQRDQARQRAAKKLEPQSVSVPVSSATALSMNASVR